MSSVSNYVSCAVLWLCLVAKAPDLLRHRGDPYLRAICAVLALAGLCFFLGAPPTIGAVNRLSGVPNLAAPLTYAAITAYGAASQVLVVYWRGGPHVHRTARRWITAYTLVVVGIAVTFALGEAPVERRTDLDTYYATTPFIGQMIVLYLAAHLAAVSVTAVSSLRWARRVRGRLRAGLAVMAIGALCNSGYSVCKLLAVGARWSGHDWAVLDTNMSPAAAGMGALITVVGVLIPLVGPWLTEWRRSWRTYVRLAPLERELDELLSRRSLRLPRPRLASPTTWLMWRQTSIHNALGYLDACLDRALYARTREAALRATGDAERAEATAWAAVIASAAWDTARREHVPPPPGGEGRLVARVPDPAALVRIADALATSELVAAARTHGGTTRTGAA
ncbi:MAB_1171c family putative transporter [Streptomyces leeuwenhoekii]|uniref:Membrane protein n=1 Tax=Streptomyces leeuwenhoekii TaxID=1437453 RepID=A0A0F7W2Z3_STRLW|nr:MAB_1171c family putative transporter [Streptomyces leeuwenhoekii]KMS81426.1 membrane protein [Streptomyces leeuwenhoekii]CQR64232.1 Integral Membrane Protein [Streptomyces leeuwenhoekii]